MGAYLPADMTQFDEVTRIVPSIEYKYDGKAVTHKRFWPTQNLSPATEQEDYDKVIRDGAEIYTPIINAAANSDDRSQDVEINGKPVVNAK